MVKVLIVFGGTVCVYVFSLYMFLVLLHCYLHICCYFFVWFIFKIIHILSIEVFAMLKWYLDVVAFIIV